MLLNKLFNPSVFCFAKSTSPAGEAIRYALIKPLFCDFFKLGENNFHGFAFEIHTAVFNNVANVFAVKSDGYLASACDFAVCAVADVRNLNCFFVFAVASCKHLEINVSVCVVGEARVFNRYVND